jgi:hypothetical protein
LLAAFTAAALSALLAKDSDHGCSAAVTTAGASDGENHANACHARYSPANAKIGRLLRIRWRRRSELLDPGSPSSWRLPVTPELDGLLRGGGLRNALNPRAGDKEYSDDRERDRGYFLAGDRFARE